MLNRAKDTAPYGYLIKPYEDKELHANIEIAHEKNKMEKSIKHLSSVLLAIRNVNQLIIKEKNPEVLFDKICQLLIETRGYKSTWIIQVDESSNIVNFVQAGLYKENWFTVIYKKNFKI